MIKSEQHCFEASHFIQVAHTSRIIYSHASIQIPAPSRGSIYFLKDCSVYDLLFQYA